MVGIISVLRTPCTPRHLLQRRPCHDRAYLGHLRHPGNRCLTIADAHQLEEYRPVPVPTESWDNSECRARVRRHVELLHNFSRPPKPNILPHPLSDEDLLG